MEKNIFKWEKFISEVKSQGKWIEFRNAAPEIIIKINSKSPTLCFYTKDYSPAFPSDQYAPMEYNMKLYLQKLIKKLNTLVPKEFEKKQPNYKKTLVPEF